jgi:hypothetical protein
VRRIGRSSEEPKNFCTRCRIPVSPFVAIVKAGNVAAAGPEGKKPGKM